jgi:hypothetical protein
MSSRHPRHSASTLRRVRYFLFRVGYVAWRTLYHEEAAWHGAIAVAVAALAAVIVVKMDPRGRLPAGTYWVPLVAAGAYCGWIATTRFRRVWPTFRGLRQEMRARRMLHLVTGGVRRRQFDRLTFLRVRRRSSSSPSAAASSSRGSRTAERASRTPY